MNGIARLSRFVRAPDPRRAGWIILVLLAPHLALGAWLLAVPDVLAFRTNQIVTLIHVVFAALSAPVVMGWMIAHARGLGARAGREGRRAAIESWALVVLVGLAMGTGGLVIWGGRIARGHELHAIGGLAVGVGLAAHLWSGRRRKAALAVAGFLVTSVFVAVSAARLIPPERVVPAEFAFRSTSSALYQPASYCGECHAEEYAEWRRSTHGTTMVHRLVRDDMEAHLTEIGFNVADYGAIVRGATANGAGALRSCERCHIPTDFYGDHREDARHPQGVAAEGITCSFCHSIRGVREGLARDKPVVLGDAGDPSAIRSRSDWQRILPRLPYFISAPEQIHRYIGEGSGNATLRWLAKTLVRWRPAVHSADYDAPVLHTAKACMPCHSMGDFDQMYEGTQKTYFGWEHSGYATSDPETAVSCQDCHMTNELTGLRSHERGRFVPWGPLRDGHVSHLGLGGNTTVASVMHDEDLEAREHAMNAMVVKLDIVSSRVAGAELDVDVQLSSRDVAHYLPSAATQSRFFWVEVSALDSRGAVLSRTPEPRSGDDVGGGAPVIFRCMPNARPECDTVLRPHEPRVMTARLELPAGTAPAAVEATLHLSIDHTPLVTVRAPLPVTAVTGG